MKFTTASFLAAAALFLGAMALPRFEEPPPESRSLDFSGVDTLRVDSTLQANVVFSRGAPQVSLPMTEDATLTVQREGRVLVIKATGRPYHDLQITAPIDLARVEGGNLSLTAKVPMQSLAVASTDQVDWEGDIAELQVRAARPASRCPHRDCYGGVNIEDGRIGQLDVSITAGVVILGAPDDVGTARLRLGPKARFTLSNATRLADVQLLPYDAAETPPAPAPETPAAPTKIAE
ncbi:hypothetical protein [Arenimonas sp. MALMAid1274]|uniref:hypothetical protein n=1 Tax=Arenimonas sp. MALMAid1274 TaxID=3411630 RepID=UPI003B9FC856